MILAGDYIPEASEAELKLGEGTVLCVLEGPILPLDSQLERAMKSGPSLYSVALPSRASGNKGDTHFALANNHFMDFGVEGMNLTFEKLRSAGSRFAGAGHEHHEARRPMVFETDGFRVGVISCCEAQYGVAGPFSPGVAVIGPWVYSSLASLHSEVDVPIVSVHAALEMSPWPSPYLQQLYRSWIDAGALIVHGHHAHTPQGVEHYADGIISYGSANMVVDPARWAHEANTLWSIAVDVDLRTKPLRGMVFSTEIRRCDGRLVVERSTTAEALTHRPYIEAVTSPLSDPELLEALWQETAVRATIGHYADPLRAPTGVGRLLSWRQRGKAALAALQEAASAFFGSEVRTHLARRNCLNWHHYFGCLSHREAIATGLGVLSGVIPDLRNETSSRMADEFMPFFPPVSRELKAFL